MSASAVGLLILVAIVVIGLITWLFVVRYVAQRPYQAHPQRGDMRGVVQGGTHVGGGRSVAPTRDAPVPQGGGEPPSMEEEVTAHDEDARQRHAN